MHLKAIALDREFTAAPTRQAGPSPTAAPGLRGEIIKSDDFADIKLFAATFLSGAAGALTEKQQTVFGPVNSPTPEQRAVRGRAGRAADLRPADLRFDPEERFLRPGAEREAILSVRPANH